MPMVTPAAMSSLKRAVGKISFKAGLGLSFSHSPMPAARIITPSSRNITCIWGLSLLACALARISDEVPGTTTTFTLFAFSKAGKTWLVHVFSMMPPFMPMYRVLVWACDKPGAMAAMATARAPSGAFTEIFDREKGVMVSLLGLM